MLAFEILCELYAELVRSFEVYRIVGRERLHDVIILSPLCFVELPLDRLELIDGGLR